ncbi:Enamine deaminase RidA, house cleaning of reactive enamine intermediates, YjgF/YER057c/UK114 family [Burkholderia sp. OK233]|nr:Enamine deaminase RidA, house cleaning of reactive enamine intermediates, YjgF/YER057c/UK114 family [Burkholderia sp. OK233]
MNPDRPHRESFDLEGISHTVPIPFGTRVGDMLFSSGIMGVDQSTGSLAEGLSAQVRFAFANMERLLKKAGGDLGDVGHVRVLVSEEGNRAAVNEEWLRAFPDAHDRPARHTVLSALRGGMLVQLEIIAVLK